MRTTADAAISESTPSMSRLIAPSIRGRTRTIWSIEYSGSISTNVVSECENW